MENTNATHNDDEKTKKFFEEKTKQFEELKKEILDELKIDEFNIQGKTLKSPVLASRYMNRYLIEKQLLDKLNRTKDKLFKKLFIKYRKGNNIANTKTEVESFVNGDDDFIKIKARCQVQEGRVNFLKEHVSIFRNLSYIYSTYVEHEKLKQGEGR